MQKRKKRLSNKLKWGKTEGIYKYTWLKYLD